VDNLRISSLRASLQSTAVPRGRRMKVNTRARRQRGGADELAAEDLADDGLAARPQDEYVINRITVGIIPKVWTELLRLMTSTKYNRTDVVNRAISVYAMVDDNMRDGYELVFRDPKTGKERIVEII
jgi:hypothetical protein